MKVLSFVAAAAVLAGVTLSASQLVVPGRAGTITPAKLSATAHPPVPNDLASMWLVPEQNAKLGPALANFVRGVRLLEEEDRAAAALPLVSDGALSTTPVADYARYYTGLALTRLQRYAEADKVFGDLAARQIDGHLPEDAAFRLAEIRETQKDYKGAVSVYESLVLKKLAQPQLAWLRLGLAADLAGQPMRSVEALQRAYYDFPTTRGGRSGAAGARQAGRRSRGAVCGQGTGAGRDAVPGAAMGGREAIVRSRQVVRDGHRSRSRGDPDRGRGHRARAAIVRAARRCVRT